MRPYSFFPCVFLIIIVQLVRLGSTNPSSKIEEGLFTQEHGRDAKRAVIVSFGSTRELKDIAQQVQHQYGSSTKEDRIHGLYQALHGYSSKCQGDAKSYLESSGYTYKGMWSSNSIVVKDADRECVNTLVAMKDVSFVGADKTLPLIDPIMTTGKVIFRGGTSGADSTLDEQNTPPADFLTRMTWGISKIRANEAWNFHSVHYAYGAGHGYGKAELKLKNGRGIVVSSIDTGVNAEHERLKDNHRNFAGWLDGYGESGTPVDDSGHGTHTLGTIAGSGGIGVAPGSQWITCRGCKDDGCLTSALLNCCQWILCPHDPDKAVPDDYTNCYTAPDLVSNSWGGGQGSHVFERCTLALQAAGIIPIFANGNEGPNCTTANSPGDLTSVIGVGATDKDDNLAGFSSRGPTVEGRVKPDISAPGVQVLSSWINATNAYIAISGTSMATPHVSGLIALMLERCRIPYNIVLNILQSTAERYMLGVTNQICGGTNASEFPNNFFGWGRINALEAVKKVVYICHLNRGSGYGHPSRVSYVPAVPYQRQHYGYHLNYYPVYFPQIYGYGSARYPYRRGY